MLKSKQKRYLKSLANTISNRHLIGKSEITSELLYSLDNALTKHELIKIGLQKSVADYKNEIASELVNELKAELVDIIGHVIILYRQSKNKENRKITLPL